MDLSSRFQNHPIMQFAEQASGWCATHTQALAGVIQAVEHRQGYAYLIGGPGSGKSALLDIYARAAQTNGVRTVRVAGDEYDTNELFRRTLNQLRIETGGRSPAWIRRRFQLAAQFHLVRNRTLALLVDDADRLTDDVLSKLHLLLNTLAGQERVLQIVLAGTPDLKSRLRASILRQLDQRINIRVELKPIEAVERLDVIDTILQHEPLPPGYKLSRWTKKRIARKSRGNPAAIVQLTREAVGKTRARAARIVKPLPQHDPVAET